MNDGLVELVWVVVVIIEIFVDFIEVLSEGEIFV